MTEVADPRARFQATALEVTNTLRRHGIPLQRWGAGPAREIGDLVSEVLNGETVLRVEDNKLTRRVNLAKIDVRYRRADGVELRLVEAQQVLADGRVKVRNLTGVSEKMKPAEDLEAAAIRALSEELGIKDKCTLDLLPAEVETQESLGYPGLMTEYRIHNMRTYLPDTAFNPEGYKEVQPGKKITEFVWEEVRKEV